MPILKNTQSQAHKPLLPAKTIVLSFLSVVIIGALLLMLPISSKSRTFSPFVESLFTATSATCVTGLVVYDTYSHWSGFGQAVILAMIQIGGLGLVTFTSFFSFAIGKKLGLRSMQLASESVSASGSGFTDIRGLVAIIIKTALSMEAVGALILMTVFVPQEGLQGIWISFFLAISAYCNAGFDILGFQSPYISLTNYADNPVVMVTIMALIVSGGLGFLVWRDLGQFRKRGKLMLHSKIMLIMTGALIVSGGLMFLICEWNNPQTLGNMPVHMKLVHSLFQSITLRTAGFNTIDPSQLTSLSKIGSILLMFVGAGSGSTGGGIKVSTFTVVAMTVVCVIRNDPETVIMKRKIEKDVVYKSLSIIVLAAIAVGITSIMLFYTNRSVGTAGIDCVFESVSAFATVGISAGPTALINDFSRILLAITMFMGRVGPVALALALTISSQKRNSSQVIPEGKIIVG